MIGRAARHLGAATVLAALLLAMAGVPASARDLSPSEALALQARGEAFDRDVRASDYDAMVDAMPPRILEALAEATDASPRQWKAAAAASMRQAFEQATILEFAMRLDRATSGTLEDGTPYAIIPTTTQIVMNAVGRIKSEAATLALSQDQRWYLIRLNDAAQLTQLRQAYPALKDVDLPTASMEFLD